MNAMPPVLTLASTSPYRRELLARLGVPFQVCAPRCDEEALKDPALLPRELAGMLAREKALSVAREFPGHHVLGSDQLVDLDGEVLGKPGSVRASEEQLARLSGRSHRLITALVLVCPGGALRCHVDVTTLRMRALSEQERQRYVRADEPLDCAGSYKIEQRGIALFESIECADFTAITGLPLLALSAFLRAEGFAVP
jgi:septum formation protein